MFGLSKSPTSGNTGQKRGTQCSRSSISQIFSFCKTNFGGGVSVNTDNGYGLPRILDTESHRNLPKGIVYVKNCIYNFGSCFRHGT